MLAILPTDIIAGSEKRMQQWPALALFIETCYLTKRWNYYASYPGSSDKPTVDAIYILKKVPYNQANHQQQYKTIQATHKHYQAAAE